MNGANVECDDPFHNNYTTGILESPCMGGRKGRDGLFPATSCIKIAGVYGKSHYKTIIIDSFRRSCIGCEAKQLDSVKFNILV